MLSIYSPSDQISFTVVSQVFPPGAKATDIFSVFALAKSASKRLYSYSTFTPLLRLPPSTSSVAQGYRGRLLTNTAPCVLPFIFYTATCGPKGHGSSLPLPSRIAADFLSPYKIKFSPEPLWVILGRPNLLLLVANRGLVWQSLRRHASGTPIRHEYPKQPNKE